MHKRDVLYQLALDEGLGSSIGNIRFHLENLFRSIDFQSKRVLDIGGGSGLYCFFAAASGAHEAICLEPILDGSTSNVHQRFDRLAARAGFPNVKLIPQTFQSYESQQHFDIIILYNSINHLDETACTRLLDDPDAAETYRVLMAKLFALSAPGASILVCDSSRANFWPAIGLPNPIEHLDWHTHQTPETWTALLEAAGFQSPQLRWRTINPLRNFGRLLLGNRLTAYFLLSHFCLQMTKPHKAAS